MKPYKKILLVVCREIMPHLVVGHVRFTAEDYVQQEFKDDSLNKYKTNSFRSLTDLLAIEAQHLENMKDKRIVKRFDTTKNIKKSLATALALITAMAEKEGYDLNDLMCRLT